MRSLSTLLTPMSPSATTPADPVPPPSPYPRRLSDCIYDCAHPDIDTVIDRLCDVVQMLVEDKSRPFQLRVLAELGSPTPDPRQQELFS